MNRWIKIVAGKRDSALGKFESVTFLDKKWSAAKDQTCFMKFGRNRQV